MDLDSLKSSWQDGQLIADSQETKSMSQIVRIVESKMNEAMRLEQRQLRRRAIFLFVVPILVAGLFYSMSDGFTDGADPISSLLIIEVMFVPILIFTWWRYRLSSSEVPVFGADIQHQLSATIDFLKRSRSMELGLLAVLVLLLLIGVGAAVFSGIVMLMIMIGSLVYALCLFLLTWRRYQLKLVELISYERQLASPAPS